MKKMIVIASLSVSLLLSSCSSKEGNEGLPINPESSNQQAYTQKEDTKETHHQSIEFRNVSFAVPSYFNEVKRMEEGTTSYVLFHAKDDSNFNVVATDLSDYNELSLEEFVNSSQSTTGYKYQSERTYYLNGYEWNELVSQNKGMQLHQTTVVKDGVYFTFTYGALEKEANKHLADIKSIVASITFL